MKLIVGRGKTGYTDLLIIYIKSNMVEHDLKNPLVKFLWHEDLAACEVEGK